MLDEIAVLSVAAIAGAITGAITGHVSSRALFSREQKMREIVDLEKIVGQIRTISVQYWNTEVSEENLLIANQIKQLFKQAASKMNIVFSIGESKIFPQIAKKKFKEVVKDRYSRLYRETTGDNFDGQDRGADSKRADRIVDLSFRFIEELKNI